MDISGDSSERLMAVFTICDPDQKGFITVDHFVNLAREHFGAGAGEQDDEDVRRIVNVLDPEGDGKIHFGEFCQGVQQILELKSPGSPTITMMGPCLFPVTRPQVLGSELTNCTLEDDNHSSGTHDTSEMSTFNEYDMMTDDDQTPMVMYPDCKFISEMMTLRPTTSSEDDHDSAFSGKSSETQEPRPEIEGTEESSRVYCDEGLEPGEANSGSHTPTKPKREEFRTHHRVTSNGLASQLFRYNTERRCSYGSDEIFDDIDGNFVELNDKVKKLEAQIQFLTETQKSNDIRHTKIKEENCSLVERVHLLEEQLRDVEQKSQSRIAEEERKYKEVLIRAEKEKSMELDILAQSVKHIEAEYNSLKKEAPRLRADNERFRKENYLLEHQLREAHQQISTLAREHSDLQHRNHELNTDFEQERRISAQLIDELSRELDELRTKMENNGLKLSPRSANHDISRTQRKEFEANISRLKEENARLRDEKEELLLSNHIQEGRSLVQGGISLADEIDNLPKDELLRTVRDLQIENDTLRQYIEKMTLRIIEKNPSILEIPMKLKKK